MRVSIMSNWNYKLTSRVPWNGSTSTPEVVNNMWCAYQIFNTIMTKEAMAGMFGNILRESYFNPGQGQIGGGGGLGLIQWTPSTSLTNYISGAWYDGDNQCRFLINDCNNQYGTRWISTSTYNYSFAEFCQVTDVDLATKIFLACRERAGVSALDLRLQYAHEFYEILGGTPPTPVYNDASFLCLAKRHKTRLKKHRQ